MRSIARAEARVKVWLYGNWVDMVESHTGPKSYKLVEGPWGMGVGGVLGGVGVGFGEFWGQVGGKRILG